MSKYTTEVRFIVENACGLTDSKGYNDVNTLITTACPLIFNFNFPIFDETYRTVLESKILKHYYTREIGFETVGLWKLNLDKKLNEIMPYYNKMYNSELLQINPLYTYTLEKTSNRTTNGNSTNNGTNTGTNSATNENINKYNDTPQGGLTGLLDGTYLTSATQDVGSTSGTYSSTNNSTATITNTEAYLDTVKGHSGISESKLLQEYRNTFINIDMLIIDELADLFMNLW